MDTLPTEPAHRAISIIVLLQVAVVLGGTWFVTVIMKSYGYESSMGFGEPFSDKAVFIRNYGFTLLLAPVLWTAGVIYAERKKEYPKLKRILLVCGLAAVFVGAFIYFIAAATCYDSTGMMGRIRGSWED